MFYVYGITNVARHESYSFTHVTCRRSQTIMEKMGLNTVVLKRGFHRTHKLMVMQLFESIFRARFDRVDIFDSFSALHR